MKLEHYGVEKLKKEILGIIGRHINMNAYSVFFFGSRVEGRGTDRSDIDVGIEGQNPVSQRVIDDILEEIDEIPTLYKIDIVDFSSVSEKFREVAHTREFIFQPG